MKRDKACLCLPGGLERLTPYSNSPKANKGSHSSDADFKRSCIPGTRRSTDTTIVVSSKTLPVAGIDFLAAFLNDSIQFRAFGFGKNSGATLNGRKALFAVSLTETMNILGNLRQFGRW